MSKQFINNTKAYLYRTIRQCRTILKQKLLGLRNCDSTFLIKGNVYIAKNLRAGMHEYVGIGCVITSNVQIGDYVMFGPNACVVGNDHEFDVPDHPIIFSGRPVPLKRKLEMMFGAVQGQF